MNYDSMSLQELERETNHSDNALAKVLCAKLTEVVDILLNAESLETDIEKIQEYTSLFRTLEIDIDNHLIV